MENFFNTLVLMSALGGILVVIIRIIKLFLSAKISLGLQKFMLIFVMIFFVVPFWKFIPKNENVTLKFDEFFFEDNVYEKENHTYNEAYDKKEEKFEEDEKSINTSELVGIVYFTGFSIFIAGAFFSYIIFLRKKKKGSVQFSENKNFEEVKKELNIKRSIRLRVSADTHSPVLLGTFFPVIYIPREIDDPKKEKMIYRHELTHFKNGDLILKWCVLFVNALHWFNPLCYILISDINEICELYCDMSVTENLSE